MNPLPPANKDSRQRISVLKKIKTAFATCPSRQSAKKFCYKENKKSLCRLCRLPRGSRQTGCAPSSHYGVRSLCRLPYWQVAKALPTAFLLAGGKGFFADEFFATCSLPTATCKAVGKAFATCFRAFADCFWQSAKKGIPVVMFRNYLYKRCSG